MTNLREVKKGKESSAAKVGDIVLVFNHNLKTGCWSVGRIKGLVLRRDNVARGTTFINRHVQKLYPLEVDTKVSIQEEKDEETNERCERVDRGEYRE